MVFSGYMCGSRLLGPTVLFTGRQWRHGHKEQACGHSAGREGGTETYMTIREIHGQWEFSV